MKNLAMHFLTAVQAGYQNPSFWRRQLSTAQTRRCREGRLVAGLEIFWGVGWQRQRDLAPSGISSIVVLLHFLKLLSLLQYVLVYFSFNLLSRAKTKQSVGAQCFDHFYRCFFHMETVCWWKRGTKGAWRPVHLKHLGFRNQTEMLMLQCASWVISSDTNSCFLQTLHGLFIARVFHVDYIKEQKHH